MQKNTGTHILGKVLVKSDFKPKSAQEYLRAIREVVIGNGMTPVGEPTFHEFPGGGFTGFLMLAESHVSLHTWFELGFVDLDVFVCNVSRDNSGGARQIFEEITKLFDPKSVSTQEIDR